jgi:ribosomal protein L35AE/L33A
MAQQNKKPSVDSRRADLEKDLIGEELELKMEMETGRRHVNEGSKYQQRVRKQNKMLSIQQGFRRRHPNRVLNQYQGIVKTTSSASSLWEKALQYETKRVDMPKDFRPRDDTDGMVNQMGVVTTALDNYKASRNKFQRMHLIGV